MFSWYLGSITAGRDVSGMCRVSWNLWQWCVWINLVFTETSIMTCTCSFHLTERKFPMVMSLQLYIRGSSISISMKISFALKIFCWQYVWPIPKQWQQLFLHELFWPEVSHTAPPMPFTLCYNRAVSSPGWGVVGPRIWTSKGRNAVDSPGRLHHFCILYACKCGIK